ncbi:hypothetical protein TNCV_5072391 [Trichonephila clavipes]|nr:hypothetical protein TNCV_5072391 [Trichonephila clavipes]
MKAALSLKRLDSLIINEKPGDLSRKDESEWESKNLDAVSYIKLSLTDEQALQFAVKPDEDVDTTLLFPNSVTQGVCRNTYDGHRFCALARLISHTHSENS